MSKILRRVPQLYYYGKAQYSNTLSNSYYGFLKEELNDPECLLEWCHDNVLYEDDNLIAVNKPAWIPQFASYDESSTKHDPLVNIDQIIPQLQERWNSKILQIALPFSRFKSGVLLFTKNPSSNDRMKQIIQTAKIQKIPFMSHLVLSVGVPLMESDCLQETMVFKKIHVDNQSVTITIPTQSKSGRSSGKEIQAFFNTNILSSNSKFGVSTLQVQTNRDKWHCLEVYLTRKLCCALGDHLYSGRVKSILGKPMSVQPTTAIIDKQTISKPIRRALNIKHETANTVPLHIHRHKVELLQFPTKKSKPIVIHAPLPEYFVQSLNNLELFSDDVHGVLDTDIRNAANV